MNTATYTPLLDSIEIPGTDRTLGGEKAVKTLQETGGKLHISLTFGYPAESFRQALSERIESALAAAGNTLPVQLDIQTDITVHKVQPGVATIKGVKNIIAIASGKGGVGKSTTTANLAMAMARMGARVGVLDADLYGPSQPTMLGVAAAAPQQQDGHFIPVLAAGGIQVMSIGFLVDTDQAVVWRGPMVSQALQQLLFQSRWDDVDYLIVDLPPGTGDIQLTLSQKIPVTGALVVTTPQDIALIDARKAVDMLNKVNIPIFGVLENMSVHVCSQCGHSEHIFGSGGAQWMSEQYGVPVLGTLPLEIGIREHGDAGVPIVVAQPDSAAAQAYRATARALLERLAQRPKVRTGIMASLIGG